MGWTGTYREPGESNRDFFQRELFPSGRAEIIDCVTLPGLEGKVFYAAMRQVETIKGYCEAGEVWALVVLMHGTPGRGQFTYKEMSEDSGPAEDRCPERILELLTPTDSEWANEWRSRCRQYAADLALLEAGRPVRFGTAYVTPEGPKRVFQRVDLAKNTFRTRVGGPIYTLAGWRGQSFEIVGT